MLSCPVCEKPLETTNGWLRCAGCGYEEVKHAKPDPPPPPPPPSDAARWEIERRALVATIEALNAAIIAYAEAWEKMPDDYEAIVAAGIRLREMARRATRRAKA